MNMGGWNALSRPERRLGLTGETWTNNIVASASWPAAPNCGPRVTLKVIFDQIDSTSTAAMLDLGLIHHPRREKAQRGISLRNIARR